VRPAGSRCLALLTFALGCGGSACPEGEVRGDADCVAYAAEGPVPAGAVWAPAPGTSWQWQLSQAIDGWPDVAMVDLDLFEVDAATVDALHAEGRVLVCYFSAGTAEDFRDDVGDLPEAALGRAMADWPDERWLDVMHPAVRDLAEARLDHAVEVGCDGVEPDNVDAYANRSGLPLNATEQLSFNRFLADEAHTRGLSVGLKNDLDQVDALEPWFDWALNESCAVYSECGVLRAFTEEAGKAAFHVEYVDDWADAPELATEVCGRGPGLSSLIKTWDLGPEFLPCG
jgi:hypothetical protein